MWFKNYKRFWVSEHHNHPTMIGTAPEILMAAIAANTKNCKGSIIDNFNGLLVEPQNSLDLANKIIMLIKI